MDDQYNDVVQKYCPVLGKNVAVELTGIEQKSYCLNEHICRKNNGECKNRLINASLKND